MADILYIEVALGSNAKEPERTLQITQIDLRLRLIIITLKIDFFKLLMA